MRPRLVIAGISGGGCMGVATLPWVTLLGLPPTPFFYRPLWTGFPMHVFAIAPIGINGLILLTIIGGAWWRRH